MSSTRQGGAGIGFPSRYNTPNLLDPSNTGWTSMGAGPITLPAGGTFIIPAGQFYLAPGDSSWLQIKDPISGLWLTVNSVPNENQYVSSDGANFRLANLSGCAVGALVTNVGSGYTSAPVVVASSGSSVWKAIVGGAVNGTVTITTAGVGYVHTPTIAISPPPAGGVQASAVATVTAGAITAVTVTNQGAGYLSVPTFTVLSDPRDSVTTLAVLTPTLTGSGTITAVVCLDHGTPLTAVPTLSFTGGGGSAAAATAVMNFVATGFTVGAGGVAYGNAQPFGIYTIGGTVTATPGATVNPNISNLISTPRQAVISGTSTAGGAITATGAVINDAGQFQSVPSALVIAGGSGLATTVGQATITVGGTTDTSLLYPF